MEKIVAACGLVCSGCFAYKATLKDNNALRIKTAEFWSTIYGAEIKPDDINCNGCLMEGVKFNHCLECEVRLCCVDKGYENCAHCPDYSCEKLDNLLANIPEGRLILDEIKATL
ncbi:MAG: DUF3795 domain-containing protein [Candidatus Cloacimonetes bacterium]|jgi:hypothetical protein|nr:DUF3795 domain-containing protein [Candidatus Cloacimonadota bacterium]